MPVFNDVKFIEESLDSILNQTFKDFILIISDDGSTDGSGDICKSYAENHERITYIRQPQNLGISKNMEFLLAQAKTPYFLWAGDDDLLALDFIEVLIDALNENKDAIGAFTTYQRIDDQGRILTPQMNFDYSGDYSLERLKKFIRNSDDIWGYGLFKTEKIRGVKFPVWWWPNKKQSYNNIFPSLCYYLARGNYLNIEGKTRFFKRNKSHRLMNHSKPPGSGLIETAQYITRRLYLVFYSCCQVMKGGNVPLSIKTFPYFFYHWFLISTAKHLQIVWKAQLIKIKG